MTTLERDTFTLVREHMSSGRASLGEMAGGHLEDAAHGAVLRTGDGLELIDCTGHGGFLLGATYPAVVEAVVAQVRRNPLPSRALVEPVAARAASALAAVCPPGLTKVHFTCSGAEAADVALKLARANGKHRVIRAVTGHRAVARTPVVSDDAAEVPYGDTAALLDVLADGVPSCFVVEPVRGAAPAPAGYLSSVARICAEHRCLFVADELRTGLGRTGRWWGVDIEDVVPDVLLVGDGLSGGVVPIAAVVAKPVVYRPFDKDPAPLSSPFTAAPVAVAAALAAIEALHAENAVPRARALGERIAAALTAVAEGTAAHLVREVHGDGLLLGVEMADAGLAEQLVAALLEQQVLAETGEAGDAVVRLAPPVVLTDEQVGALVTAVEHALDALAHRFPPVPGQEVRA